ncbi:protein FAM200A-like [Macrobrachium rosenbergii]|uniref:protein FAM200A-like n=1 Tax=Macrobrachium rosenbergii TaxID=79674 RepID=UPI0034D781CE
MQGRKHVVVNTAEKIASYTKNLALWWKKLANGKTAAFLKLSAMLEDSSDTSLPDIMDTVKDHLSNLQEEMNRYIPENVDLKNHSCIRNAFTVNVTEVGEDIPGFQEKHIDLQYLKYWIQLQDTPSILTRETEKALLHFPATYLPEVGFSNLVTIKTSKKPAGTLT